MNEQNQDEQIDFHIDMFGLLYRNFNERYERITSSDEEVHFSSNSTDDDERLLALADVNINPLYKFQPYILVKRNLKRRSVLNIPEPRSGHQVIATESNVFVLGGYNPRTANAVRRQRRRLIFQDLWSFNDATNRWHLVLDERSTPDMPSDLTASAFTLWRNCMISYGGTGFPFGESRSNDCILYTTGRNPAATKLLVSGDLPPAVYGAAIAIHDDFLYTIGGTTGYDFFNHVYSLDLKSLVWKVIYSSRPGRHNNPVGRYGHGIVNDGNYLYLLGGGTAQQICVGFDSIEAFNIKSHCWENFYTYPDESPALYIRDITGYPKARKCFGCAQYTTPNGDVEVVISGGCQADSRSFFSDVWKINMRTKQWTLLRTARLPTPIFFHSASCSETGAMYLFGGISCDVWSMKRRNALYKMWVTIPKLSEMCWEAILYYNKNLASIDRNKLRASGIPDQFIARIPSSNAEPVALNSESE